MLCSYADKLGVMLTFLEESKTFPFSWFTLNVLKPHNYKIWNVMIHKSASPTYFGQWNKQTEKLTKFY